MQVLDEKPWPPATPDSWSGRITCTQCKSVLQVEVDDIQAHRASRTGDSYGTSENFKCYFITCPVCKHHREIGVNDFHAYWIKQIDERCQI